MHLDMGTLTKLETMGVTKKLDGPTGFLASSNTDTQAKLHGQNRPPLHISNLSIGGPTSETQYMSLPYGTPNELGNFRNLFTTYVDQDNLYFDGYSETTEDTKFGSIYPTNESFYLTSLDKKFVSRYYLSQSGLIKSLYAYEDASVGSDSSKLMGIIYTDNAGTPDELFAVGDEVTTSGDAARWYKSNFTGVYLNKIIPAGYYWIGFIMKGVAVGLRGPRGHFIMGTGNNMYYNDDTYAGGPTDPFGAYSENEIFMATYVTYAPLTGVGGTPISYIYDRWLQ